MAPDPVAAIILAGGRSRRMRRDKPLLPLGERTLIEALISQIRPCFQTIVVSAGDRSRFAFLGLPVIVDDSPGKGPLAAMLTALRASPCRTNFVMACDIPVVHLPFLRRLLSLAPGHEIVVPRYRDGKLEPLFAAYDRGIVPAIARQLEAGDYRIASLFHTCRTRFVPMDGQRWFRNLNTLEEYHAYLESQEKDGA